MHANRQIPRTPLMCRTLSLSRSSLRSTTSLTTGKALAASEVLKPSDEVAQSGGLLSCMNAYIRYRALKHPGKVLPAPDYVCGPHDPEVDLRNVLAPEMWEIMCTSCGATDEWLQSFIGEDSVCLFVKCLRCERDAALDDDTCGTFLAHDQEEDHLWTWISVREPRQEATKDAQRKIAGRPSRSSRLQSGASASVSDAHHGDSKDSTEGVPDADADEEAAFSALAIRRFRHEQDRASSPSPPSPKVRATCRSAKNPVAGRRPAGKQFHKVRKATINLELLMRPIYLLCTWNTEIVQNGKSREFRDIQIVDNRLEWESVQDIFLRILTTGRHGLEGFDGLYQNWRRFGLDGNINLRLRQRIVRLRIVHAAALPVELVELPSDHVHAGQKRNAPAPLTMSRPTKRSKVQ